jgi:hypothetical protein
MMAATSTTGTIRSDRLQRRGPIDAVPTGCIVDRQPQHGLDVDIAANADDLAVRGPVDHRAALDPAAADDEIRILGCGQQSWQLLGLVAAVGVHLHGRVVIALDRPGKTRLVCRPETLLAGAVHDVDLRVGGGEGVRDLTSAIGRVVIQHQNVDRRHAQPNALDHERQVLALVVGRDQDDDAKGTGCNLV